MNSTQALLLALMLLVLALLCLTWILGADKRHQQVQQRWQRRLDPASESDSHTGWLSQSATWIALQHTLQQGRQKLRGLAPEDEDRFERVYIAQILVVWGVFMVLLLKWQGGFQVLLSVLAAILFAVLRWQALKKQLLLRYEEQLPGVVDHIRRAVSSGLSVPQALASAAQQSQVPISTELQRLSHQLQLGIALSEVVQQSRIRIPVREYHFLGMILQLNQKTGGRLAEALENLSQGLRERKAMKMKLASMTSEPRTTALIVSTFPPLTMLGLALFNPDQLDFLLHDSTGQMMLLYVGVSVTIGLTMVHRMARGGIA